MTPAIGLTRRNIAAITPAMPDKIYHLSPFAGFRKAIPDIMFIIPAAKEPSANNEINTTAPIKGLKKVNIPAIILVTVNHCIHLLFFNSSLFLIQVITEMMPSTIINTPRKIIIVMIACTGESNNDIPNTTATIPRTRQIRHKTG